MAHEASSLSTLPFDLLQEIARAVRTIEPCVRESFRLTNKALRNAYDTTMSDGGVSLGRDSSDDEEDEDEAFERNLACVWDFVRRNKNIAGLDVLNVDCWHGWGLSCFERMCNDDIVQKQITRVMIGSRQYDRDELWRVLAIVGNNLKGLKELIVRGYGHPDERTTLTEERMAYVGPALAQLTALTKLHMCTDVEEAPELSAIIINNLEKLETLDLAYSIDHDSTMIKFVPSIINLRHLCLDSCCIGPESARAMAEAFRGGILLRSLDLDHCFVDDGALEILCPSIRSLTSLEKLFVEGGRRDCRIFEEDMAFPPSLVELRLFKIDFGCSLEGVGVFTNRLKRLTSLRSIHVGLAGIDAPCVDKVTKALQELPALEYVRVEANESDDVFGTAWNGRGSYVKELSLK